MTFSLFFPQKTQAKLINRAMKMQILDLLHFFAKLLIDSAVAFYIEKKVADFDPHIGDTLCQIRACMVLEIYLNFFPKNFEEILKKIKALEAMKRDIAQNVLEFNTLIKENNSKYHKDLDKNECLEEFLHNRGLNFLITPELIFLTKAKILTLFSKVDAQGISRGINYDKFCEEAKITKTLAKKIMHSYQQDIAKSSCEFIFNVAGKDYQPHANLMLLPYMLHVDSDSRFVLPTYEVTKVLLHYIYQNNFLIIIELEKENITTNPSTKSTEKFLFRPATGRVTFELIQKDAVLATNIPCLVITGMIKESYPTTRDFLSNVQTLGLYNIILMNMAKHPQYSDIKASAMSHNPYVIFNESNVNLDKKLLHGIKKAENEFLHMQERAMQYGCCLETPSLFLIKHIFCDMISNQIPNITFSTHTEDKSYNISQDNIVQLEVYQN